MRKIFTLFLSVLFVSGAFAQRPEAVIKRTDVKPELDGVIEDVWAMTDSLSIDRPFTGTVPTLGDPGETYWKMLWDDDGIYLLVNVTDNEYFPNYVKGSGDPWNYDKLEIYFDVNYILEDAKGPSTANSGHIQMAPDMALAKEGGSLNTEDNGRQHAFLVTKPNYVAEYFVPWASLKDQDGAMVDKSGVVGFDVTVNDSDPEDDTRRRSVWANDNSDGAGEAWTNMDACGTITFEGAEAPTYIDEIILTVDGAITVDNQTLQIMAEVLPEDASDKTVKWMLTAKNGGAVRATISSAGVITPVVDEELIVQAVSPDGFVYSNELEVSITGQVLAMEDANIVKNGYFDQVTETGAPSVWGNWVDGAAYGPTPTVVDGVAVLDCQQASADNWHYQFNQQNLAGVPNIPYVFKFKAWGSVGRQITVDFEDTSGNGYNRYGISSDAESNGRSEWTFDITTDPQWFTFHVTFDQIIPTTVQKIQYMISQAVGTVYLDSISVVSESDMALLPTAISQVRSMESFKVYPNPAVNKLNIDLSIANSSVAIYNSVGVKMEEVTVSGTHHVFDVSRYTKGLYFVKANGAVVKFIK